MTGASRVWLGIVALALASLLASAVGFWPNGVSPAPTRADLRPPLRARHVGDRSLDSEHVGEVSDAEQLTAEWLCGEPRAGELSALTLPGADALAVPCGDGLELWAVSVAQPVRLSRVTWGSEGLRAGRAAAADLDSDGQVDLLWVLQAEEPRQVHREGLYWARGRLQGGYEPPRAIVDGRVLAFLIAEGGKGGVWVSVAEPAPEARNSVWHVDGGASPARGGQWSVPSPVVDLALAPAHVERGPVLLALFEGALWTKDVAGGDFVPTELTPVGARGFVELDGTLHVAMADGLARLSLDAEQPSLGEPHGPLAPEAVAGLASGQRLACARGALFTWRAGQRPKVLGAVGGGRVEGLVQQHQAVWLWLSGLEGGAGSGVVRLADPWPPAGPVRIVVRHPEPEGFQAVLRVP